MIGDTLTYHESFKPVTQEIISKLKHRILNGERLCIAVGGESGSGKTSLAYALFVDLQKALDTNGYIFHADDYFHLPPKDNHNKRLKDISNVGISEVNLQQLDKDILAFVNAEKALKKPLVDYGKNTIGEEKISPNAYDFCIVEGTYTMLLNQPDFKVFMSATYKDTKENRVNRARDLLNEFNERVLEIEHQIIKAHAKHANLLV